MKELIENILAYIPEYLLSLGALLARPKTFLIGKLQDLDTSFRDGLLFMAVSISISIIASTSLATQKSDIWQRVGAMAIMQLLGVSLMAGALRIAWRVVGGTARFKVFFTIYLYTSAVALLWTVFIVLLGDGTFKVMDPALYHLA